MPVTASALASRARLRSWWADGLEAALWLLTATALALFIASGGLLTTAPIDYLYSLGRAAGIVAAALVMNQLLLISRVPIVERAVGHDRAAAIHTRMGKVAFLVMLGHVALILAMSAYYDGVSLGSEVTALWSLGWFMVAAQAALALFTVVVVTSLLIVRRRWRYESWHAVHLLVYVAIALVIPHQFIQGSTFRSKSVAWWFWVVLYAGALGAWLVFRVIRPLVHLSRHELRVAEVTEHPDGSTSLTMTGRNVGRLAARPGQFFLWRFLAPGMWREAHPFSLSRAPGVHDLRITVKPSGDFSSALASVPIGTRVVAEGPLGVFSEVARTRHGVVLVAAGIGITPVRAMLEAHADGPCDVIIRARSGGQAPLLDEVRELAAAAGATVHELFGPRGHGWSTASGPARLADLVPDIAERDVYVCGPVDWAAAVADDARRSGVPAAAVHRERFGWS